MFQSYCELHFGSTDVKELAEVHATMAFGTL
jgi:hypothetical protein